MSTDEASVFRVVKSLNSSVVLVEDDNHQEWLLLGKGIGFRRRPGDAVDPNTADRAFVPLARSGTADHIRALSFLTPDRLSITEDVVRLAEERLGVSLNPYILVALTDHLAFVLERARSGSPVMPALSWEVADLYPEEYQVANEALAVIEKHTGTRLPPQEAVSITLHLVNAEQADSDMPAVARLSAFLDWFSGFVDRINPTADQRARARLLRHGRSLFQRILAGDLLDSDVGGLYRAYALQEPTVAAVVAQITEHLHDTGGIELPAEERFHLALYLRPILIPTDQ